MSALSLSFEAQCADHEPLNLDIGNALIAGMDEDLQSNPRREDWYEYVNPRSYLFPFEVVLRVESRSLTLRHLYLLALENFFSTRQTLTSSVKVVPDLILHCIYCL